MKQYELETGTIGFVGIDKEAFSIRVIDNNIVYDTLERYSKLNLNPKSVPIPESFIGLGIFSQLKEEDVKEVMSIKNTYCFEIGFIPYINGVTDDEFETALQAIHSLAQHLGLDAFNPMDKSELLGSDINVEAWLMKAKKYQEAQSKLKQYFVIFKPKQKCTCTDEQSWNCIECIKPR